MTFLFPSLVVAGGVLALAPIVAHLLNRRRRRRVAWGAMEFLLESDRRNRTRVRLSEWLLLLVRVLLMAGAGMLAAGPRGGGWLDAWLDRSGTTHLVLLDDSLSMSSRSGDGSPWDDALDAVTRLIETTGEQGRADRVVVLRYADHLTGADPFDEPGRAALAARWRRWSQSAKPTSLSVGPVEGVDRLIELMSDAEQRGGARSVWVLSDFTRWNHERDGELLSVLAPLTAEADRVVLSPCGESGDANRTLESLTLDPGPRADGVEARLRVAVRNQGSKPAAATTVRLRRDGTELPAIAVRPLEPGELHEMTTPVVFLGEGEHTLEVALAADALPGDNRRWMALDLPAANQVLAVDGSIDQREGRAYAAALQPRGPTRTGWVVKRTAARRPETLGDLSSTAVVLLLDTQRWSPQVEQELKRFLESGGGALVVLGPRAEADDYNSRLFGPEGMAPGRLDLPTPAPWIEADRSPFRVAPHPALDWLKSQNGTLGPLARVAMRHSLVDSGEIDPPSSPLRLTDGQPLWLESRFGKGRLIVLLTTAASVDDSGVVWSNLATTPVFPILANQLVGWLSQERLRPLEVTLGEPLPTRTRGRSAARLERLESGRWVDLGPLESGRSVLAPAAYRVTSTEGVTLLTGGVDPREGDLARTGLAELKELVGSLAEVAPADRLFRGPDDRSDATPTHALVVGMLGLLILERALATACSYLPPAEGGDA